jgi:signal peptidase I
LDLALIIVGLTFLAGIIWAVDLLFLQSRREAAGSDAKEPLAVEYARAFFPILLFVLILRSFLFEPFRIPSGSMTPTLLDGDFIFVNKFVYGLRLPVLNTKVVPLGLPERGDVVVFKLPSDPSIHYIKRVIGLPGDVVVYRDKQLTINGERMPLNVLGDYTGPGQAGADLIIEELGERSHELLVAGRPDGREGIYRVPEAHYFMMGDNRDRSKDSRYTGVEYIPEHRLVGRAERIWMNWRSPNKGGPLWARIGDAIN